MVTQLAVEHVQPKDGHHGHPDLKGRWENYLLGCVNCNSTKGDKQVDFDALLFPDRDNTYAAFSYGTDGTIDAAADLTGPLRDVALATLALTGLDKPISEATDENGRLIAIDRVGQRMETWLQAKSAKEDLAAAAEKEPLRHWIVNYALERGFFSIWMAVFADDPAMRNRFIDAFDGTRASGCFDPATTQALSPAPNPDGLPGGGKV